MVVVLGAIWIRDLLAATMLMGIFSLLAAALYVLLDAVDVALTEAAVGAGISIILMLAAMALTTFREKRHRFSHNALALVVVLVTGGALIYGTLDMPRFGDPEAPAQQHVSPRYTQESPTEIGIPNMVTSVLASYRGLDTLGEVMVILAAGLGVILILGSGDRPLGDRTPHGPPPFPTPGAGRAEHRGVPGNRHSILRIGAKLMIPMILLFAFYVQFHGEYSPGGGFQAGIILAAALVLYALIFGLAALQRAIPPAWAHGFVASGALLYMGVGIASMLRGGNFLEYKVLAEVPQTGETIGIILIELGVGITVASVVLTLFYAFAGHGHRHRD